MCYHTIEISSNSVNVNPSQNPAFLQRKISSPALVYPSSFFIFSKDKNEKLTPLKSYFSFTPTTYVCVCVLEKCAKSGHTSLRSFFTCFLSIPLSLTHKHTHTILTLPWRSPPLVNDNVCVCVCLRV